VQDVDRAREAYRVDRAVCVPIVVLDHLEHTASTEALQRLCLWVLTADLREVKRETERILHRRGAGPKIFSARAHPQHGFHLTYIWQFCHIGKMGSYQTLRSVSDHHVFVVCRDGTFYELVPEDVRHRGPWRVMHRGEIEKLRPEYRLALARDGYALVTCELALFKPEA
jgi:hypothetical protein